MNVERKNIILAVMVFILITAVAMTNLHAVEAPLPDESNLDVYGDLNEETDFNGEIKQIETEIIFIKLREKRRKLIQDIPKAKAELDEQISRIADLEKEKTDLESKQKKLIGPIPNDINMRIVNYESIVKILENKLKDMDDAIPVQTDARVEHDKKRDSLRNDIAKLKSELSGIYAEKKRNEGEVDGIKIRLAEIGTKIEIAEITKKRLANKHSQLVEMQLAVEDKINTMLIPETAKNKFKLYITAAFAILVGIVIVGFFITAFQDENVRRAIFSSQSGIQFLTLFSLVIAIILFGITEILEGKELAALLGGLSGYILGRVSTNRASGE